MLPPQAADLEGELVLQVDVLALGVLPRQLELVGLPLTDRRQLLRVLRVGLPDARLVGVPDGVVALLQLAVRCLQPLVLLVLLELLLVGLDLDARYRHLALLQHAVVQRVHLDAVLSRHRLHSVHEQLVLGLHRRLQRALEGLDALAECLLGLARLGLEGVVVVEQPLPLLLAALAAALELAEGGLELHLEGAVLADLSLQLA